jgi:hypothetical protein
MDCMNALDTDMTEWWGPTGDSNLSHGQGTRLDPTFFSTFFIGELSSQLASRKNIFGLVVALVIRGPTFELRGWRGFIAPVRVE